MIDLHTHILPCMDDGSASVQQSLQMLSSAFAQGVCHIAATPHFYAHRENPEQFLRRREHAYRQLMRAMQQEEGPFPAIYRGAEVRYYEGISQSERIARLQIEGMHLFLLEMPFAAWSERTFWELRNLQQRLGIPIVLAHIERYLQFQSTACLWRRLEEAGVLVQSNARFFLDKGSRRRALKLFEAGRIHFLASDCHDCAVRPPNLGEAVSLLSHYADSFAGRWERQFAEELIHTDKKGKEETR